MKKIQLLFFSALFVFIALKTVVAAPPDVTVQHKDGIGNYLADVNGRTLYWSKNDSPGKSACIGSCAEKWPPFFSGAILSASPYMNAGEFGVIERADGKKQNTFRGFPLYYYSVDIRPGDTAGHNLGSVWFVIDPEKFKPPVKEYYGLGSMDEAKKGSKGGSKE